MSCTDKFLLEIVEDFGLTAANIEGLIRIRNSFEANPGIVSQAKVFRQGERCVSNKLRNSYESFKDFFSAIILVLVLTFIIILIYISIVYSDYSTLLTPFYLTVLFVFLLLFQIYLIGSVLSTVFVPVTFAQELAPCEKQFDRGEDAFFEENRIRFTSAVCSY